MSTTPRCPSCRRFVYLDTLVCPACGTEMGLQVIERVFEAVHAGRTVVDGVTWFTCSERDWGCNWLVREDAPAGRCSSCRLTRRRPDADDTIALEKLATVEEAKRRLVLQIGDLGPPIEGWYQKPGGLGFDLLSSRSDGEKVTIGHANGIITTDLAESLDDVREAVRVKLGEPYRTVLGHLRHEAGHYFQNVLITDDATWSRCRELFGDERESYRDALNRHYEFGAPQNWSDAFISEYATMHPWEDFAETFAHYLHIVGTLQTAAAIGIHLEAGASTLRDTDVEPREDYGDQSVGRTLSDWAALSQAFNRVNRSMGLADLYPFTITPPVQRKLAFIHEIITRARLTTAEQVELALAPQGDERN
ncbi:zinc-binding metallopeptidase family protein [Microbacterium sp. bgisy203]|uniref:zinc-binding metallopeptidase family protein n=1 Tax=Microbacterium sp. bgisy203 TaxID=3413799 RepID=UPI003D75E605